MKRSGHVDTFAEAHLPPAEALPEMLFTLRQTPFPETINAAAWLLDRNLELGYGERRCVVAPDGFSWTYRELFGAVNRIANALTARYGLRPGNRVLLRAPNTPMLAACWLAVLKAGGIAVTTMPLYRSNELRVIAEKARVTLALCDVRLFDELSKACEGLDGVGTVGFGMRAESELEAAMATQSDAFDAVATSAEDVALIAFTSGTTGRPKAAMHYHRDLLATCDTYGARVLQPRPGDLFCGSAPLGFTFGLGGHAALPVFGRRRDAAAGEGRSRGSPARRGRVRRDDDVHRTDRVSHDVRRGGPLRPLDVAHVRLGRRDASDRRSGRRGATTTGLKILDGIGSTEMLHIFVGSPEREIRPGATGRAVPDTSQKCTTATDGRYRPARSGAWR